MAQMTDLALDAAERRMIDELIDRLRTNLGDELVAVWLYGSRARGERHEDSDIDLLVLTADDGFKHGAAVSDAAFDVALKHDRIFDLATISRDIEWLENRRAIRSFFVQEIDRDKVILYGRDL